MKLPAWLGRFLFHRDPLAAAANLLALSIVANQPFYPAMLALAAGKFVPASLWTFLSTPGFAAVPALARRSSRAGRALLVLTGTANTLLCVALYGEESGVGLFLLPCALIAALAFRREENSVRMPLLSLPLILFIGLRHHVPARTPAIDPASYDAIWGLHAGSVAMLIALIGLLFAGVRQEAPSSEGAHHDPGEGEAERG